MKTTGKILNLTGQILNHTCHRELIGRDRSNVSSDENAHGNVYGSFSVLTGFARSIRIALGQAFANLRVFAVCAHDDRPCKSFEVFRHAHLG